MPKTCYKDLKGVWIKKVTQDYKTEVEMDIEEKVDTVATEEKETKQEEKKEKTFTQAELDKAIKDRLARVPKKAVVEEQPAKQEESEEPKEDLEKTTLKQENLALKANVDPKEVDFVVYKVGKIEGDFEENLTKFIEENPRFTKTEKEQKEKSGFVIGSDGEEKEIENSKKQEKTNGKRWNRFN